uniref:Uncharacterized protein n=1 Tax=Setaria italica TaxID=4555 RepID=K4A3R9_SETIT
MPVIAMLTNVEAPCALLLRTLRKYLALILRVGISTKLRSRSRYMLP